MRKLNLLLTFTHCYCLIVRTAISFFSVFLRLSWFPNACLLLHMFVLYPFVDGGKDMISPNLLCLVFVTTDGFDSILSYHHFLKDVLLSGDWLSDFLS